MRALITGVAGQDGLFLSEYLLGLGYDVYGLVRAGEEQAPGRTEIAPQVHLLTGDLGDTGSLVRALELSQPDEVYNLAATSSVARSWQQAELAGDVTGMGALRVLEAVRAVTGDMSGLRVYQASSSEIFGRPTQVPQTERTPLNPTTPYGVAKAFAHQMTATYREYYGAFACCGILYNHESERRPHHFVTRKITSGVARIKLGLQRTLTLGDLDAERDWGFAGDYVRAMHAMLQQPAPADFVVATGHARSVRELAAAAFTAAGLCDWESLIEQDPRLHRQVEVGRLVGDATLARTELGWKPEVTFDELVSRMLEHDLRVESQR